MRPWEVAWDVWGSGFESSCGFDDGGVRLAGRFIGWRRATKPIYRRTYADVDVPEGLTRREYDRGIRRQRKRWRLFITVVYAIAGAIGGLLFLFFLARR